MENAVIGVFDDFQHAQDAADALVKAGFREWAVQITPKEESTAARETALDDHARYSSSEGWSIGNFFRSLFGLDADHEHAHVYAEAMRRGSFLLTVEAEGDGPMEQAREIISQFHPVDVHQRAAHWRNQGWSRFEPGSKPYTPEQVQSERSAYETMAGGGQRGNAAVQTFRRPGEGASPGGGSEFPAGTEVTGTGRAQSVDDNAMAPAQAQGAQHSYQSAADMGGGAGYGAAGTAGAAATSGAAGASSARPAGSASDMAQDLRPSGSGGTLGGLGAGNADLHESSGLGGAAPGASSAGSMLGQSMGGGEMRDPLMGTTPGVESAGMAGDATDRVREEVMGGESLGRDTMSGNQSGSVREAMGAGSGSGDPSSTGIAGAAGVGNTASQSQGVYDQGMGRQTAAAGHHEETTSGIMGNAAMRDSTAPDIYHMEHDADYRTHWQKAYHMQGRYEDFEPAYRFGADLHNKDELKRYHNWNEVEPEARRHWEAGSHGDHEGAWDKARDAVRHAWERIKHQS